MEFKSGLIEMSSVVAGAEKVFQGFHAIRKHSLVEGLSIVAMWAGRHTITHRKRCTSVRLE
jgi:hypothetical protein